MDNKRAKRHARILEMLDKNENVKIEAFCEALGCSESTIRNDLGYLESLGELHRVFGGAIKVSAPLPTTPPFAPHQYVNIKEKQIIAEYVAGRYIENRTIILDAGSTAYEIAKKIKEYGLNTTVLTASARPHCC